MAHLPGGKLLRLGETSQLYRFDDKVFNRSRYVRELGLYRQLHRDLMSLVV